MTVCTIFSPAICLLLIFCGCSAPDKPDQSKGVAASADTIIVKKPFPMPGSRIDSLDYAIILNKKLPLWVHFCKQTDPDFVLNKYNKSASIGFDAGKGDSLEGKLDPDLLKYIYIPSIDPKLLLDIYTYRFIIKREQGHLHLEGGDPESTIETIDLKKRIVKRILMVGMDGGFDDACWIDAHTFLVTGSKRRTSVDSLFDQCFYVYDLEKERMLIGTWPSHGKNTGEDYLAKWKGPKIGVKWN
jgi:hypothetical protein